MKLEVEVSIQGKVEDVWKVITDIENCADTISAIIKVEVHHNPGDDMVGYKWTETRTMFGKTATETMWITEAKVNAYYKTRAESHGAVYLSITSVHENNGETILRMVFESHPQTLMAKILGGLLAPLFKKATIKALHTDLLDIKKAVEANG